MNTYTGLAEAIDSFPIEELLQQADRTEFLARQSENIGVDLGGASVVLVAGGRHLTTRLNQPRIDPRPGCRAGLRGVERREHQLGVVRGRAEVEHCLKLVSGFHR